MPDEQLSPVAEREVAVEARCHELGVRDVRAELTRRSLGSCSPPTPRQEFGQTGEHPRQHLVRWLRETVGARVVQREEHR